MTAVSTGQLVDLTMPKLSDSMEEATVLAWLKKPGEAVEKGEPLVEIETDKATVVYEAEREGVLAEIVIEEGGTAKLGEVIARLAAEGAAPAPAPVAPPPDAAPAAPEPVEDEVSAPAAPEPGPAPEREARPRATPVARRLAEELGVDLAHVNGTGPGGRIVEADVRGAAPGTVPDMAGTVPDMAGTVPDTAGTVPDTAGTVPAGGGRGDETVAELTGTRRTIATRMSRSRREIPEFTVELEIDMEAATAVREDLRVVGREPLPSVNDLLVRAAALCLREFPALNAGFVEGHVVRYGRVNVGIAVATDDALIVPTVFDADRKSLFEIAAASREAIEKVRSRRLAPEDVADGTFTVSNLGMFGIRRFNAVINPPQVAILAAGAVERRPVVLEDGSIVARKRMEVALSCDHRVVYGAEGARFLQRLKELLEHPVALVTEG